MDNPKPIPFFLVVTKASNMFSSWFGGWFITLFVKAEDLHVLAPVGLQSWCRILGFAMITLGLCLAAFFAALSLA